MDARPFQVDLQGVVDLLGRHIYSSPRVYLRELLQNGVDAITARKTYCEEESLTIDPTWGITIYPAENSQFVLVDEGMGLTCDEVTELLATVGRSSKRDILNMARTDYLGQFGIGLLSCFMISDEIRILTRSATGSPCVEWVGSGDGTFSVRELDLQLPVGTRVYLTGRFDTAELVCESAVSQLAALYGQYLPVPIDIASSPDPISGPNPATDESQVNWDKPEYSTRINAHPIFLDESPDPAELTVFAQEELGFEPLDVINLSAPGTGTRGKGFVLPYAPPPNAHQSTQVYLGRMMLSQREDELLPDWAFFVRAVLDSTGLSPTASREGIVEDFSLEYTRDQLGACVRSWLMDMAVHHPHRFETFLSVHELAIKQLVLHDEEMAMIFMGWLSV
ncbi:MAG: ATP-binding protein, partial [Propionibacteriaceae bacterium]|nr:ATP-binding protein [Propionibacteriaceae bacterium]